MAQSGSLNLSTGGINEEFPFSATIGMVVVLCVGDLLSVVGNILVLAAVIGNTKLQTNTNFFIMNLSVIDLLAGVLLIPLVINSVLHKNTQTGDMCNVLAFVDSVYATATSLTIACIAIDRYHSIVNCLHYEYLVTQRRTKLAIAWAWIQSLLVALCPVVDWGNYIYRPYQFKCSLQVPDKNGFLYFMIFTCVVVPYAVTVFCYTRIHLVARRHAKNIVRIHIQHNGKRIRRSHSSRKTRLVYLVVGLYSVCWLPIYSLKLIQTIVPNRPLPWPYIETVFTTFALLNGSFNPVLYALITTHYRAGLVRLYKRLRRRFGKRVSSGQDVTKSSFSFSRSVSSFYRYMAEREAMAKEMASCTKSRKSVNRCDSLSISNSRHSSNGERGRRQGGPFKQTLAIPNEQRGKQNLKTSCESFDSNGVARILPGAAREENELQVKCAEEERNDLKKEAVNQEEECTIATKTASKSLSSPPLSEGIACKEKPVLQKEVTGKNEESAETVSAQENGVIDCILRKQSKKSAEQSKKIKIDIELLEEQTESLMKDGIR